MKTVSEIYTKYRIMPNLQLHQLRVAAVAALICDHLTIAVDTHTIILACLFHDMGNIIKSNLAYFPEFNKPQGIEYWAQVKKEYIDKYGADEALACREILKELGFDFVMPIFNSFGFPKACQNLRSNDFAKMIAYYADQRVAPMGILSVQDRLTEGRTRYKDRLHDLDMQDRSESEQCIAKIEQKIFAQCSIKPEDITDEAVAPIILKLKDFVVK